MKILRLVTTEFSPDLTTHEQGGCGLPDQTEVSVGHITPTPLAMALPVQAFWVSLVVAAEHPALGKQVPLTPV